LFDWITESTGNEMTVRDELMAAVIESPDSDDPRQVFADWLDEHGERERAEFIRVQCQLAGDDLSPQQRTELKTREEQLLQAHSWDWAGNFGNDIYEWQFERGFIERAHVNLEYSADTIQSILQKEPIRHLRDTNQFCELEVVVECLPLFERLTGLEFWYLYAFDDDLMRKVLLSPYLRNLKTLILHHDRNGNLVDEQVIIDGLLSPHRANIEELAVNVDCSWRGPSNEILRTIAESPYLRKLRRLNLSNAGDVGNTPALDVATVELLANSPNLQNLEELDLRSIHASEPVWEAILAMPVLAKIKRVYLGGSCEIPTTGHWIPIVGRLEEMPRWRNAWEQTSPKIDWETRFIDPYNQGEIVWRGQSWEQRKERYLFAMAPQIRSQAFAELESKYRNVCVEWANERVAAEVEQVDFQPWETPLTERLLEAVAAAQENDADTIFLRIRPDLDWGGNFGVHVTYEHAGENWQPWAEFSYSTPEFEFETPPFEAVSELFETFRNTDTNPNGGMLYLIARAVAAFARCLNQMEPFPQTVYFSCMWAVFRMR